MQHTYEKQIKQLFDYPLKSNGPKPSSTIFCILGFTSLRIIGINHTHAQIRDLTISIIHGGFFTHVQVWVKLKNGKSRWITLVLFQRICHFTTFYAWNICSNLQTKIHQSICWGHLNYSYCYFKKSPCDPFT